MATVSKEDALKAVAKATQEQARLKRNRVKSESKAARVKAGETFE